MPNVVLGVCGSIACYRAADLARDLMREGWSVRVCLTDAAAEFVKPLLFETLTGSPALTSVFDEPERGLMAHIDWARWADLVVIAPATANTISQIAFGQSNSMLSSLVQAYEGPMVLAPAMNPAMLAQPAIQEALDRLASQGARIVEPVEGDVASGEFGPGKLATTEAILQIVRETQFQSESLLGKRVLITSGPTREYIDSVRYLSNRSSGKMGIAIVHAARERGADVTLVTGPTSEPLPRHVQIEHVVSATDMLAAVQVHAPVADIMIGAAAVADYRPKHRVAGKLRRETNEMTLELESNPDIIAQMARMAKPGCLVVGFAAEPSDDLAYSREKLARKGLAAIVHNDVSGTRTGFETDTNDLTLLFTTGDPVQSGLMSKRQCANWLMDQLHARITSKT